MQCEKLQFSKLNDHVIFYNLRFIQRAIVTSHDNSFSVLILVSSKIGTASKVNPRPADAFKLKGSVSTHRSERNDYLKLSC